MLFGKQVLLYADTCHICKPFTVFSCLSKGYEAVKGFVTFLSTTFHIETISVR